MSTTSKVPFPPRLERFHSGRGGMVTTKDKRHIHYVLIERNEVHELWAQQGQDDWRRVGSSLDKPNHNWCMMVLKALPPTP